MTTDAELPRPGNAYMRTPLTEEQAYDLRTPVTTDMSVMVVCVRCHKGTRGALRVDNNLQVEETLDFMLFDEGAVCNPCLGLPLISEHTCVFQPLPDDPRYGVCPVCGLAGRT